MMGEGKRQLRKETVSAGRNEILRNNIPGNDILGNDILGNEILRNDILKNDILKNDILKNDILKNDILKNDILPGTDMPLGVSVCDGRLQFAVSLPGTDKADLVLYEAGAADPMAKIPMYRQSSGIFSVSLPLAERAGCGCSGSSGRAGHRGKGTSLGCTCGSIPVKAGQEYLYRTADGLICDPYATQISGRLVFGQEPPYVRAVVCVPKAFQGVYRRHPMDELILYKLHVRGFTMGRGSGVRKKGTYAGLVEKIPYLKELGVTGILLLPITEFDELEEAHAGTDGEILGKPARRYEGMPTGHLFGQVTGIPKEQTGELPGGQAFVRTMEKTAASRTLPQSYRLNYWGYARQAFYFAPKASYASKPGRAAEEVQEMVAAFHAAGIDIYLEMMFDQQCTQSQMLDCLRFWVRTYGIDGFHVNDALLPLSLPAGDAYLQETAFFATDIPDGLKGRYPGRFAEYRDAFLVDMRRYLKGDEGMVPTFYYYMKYHPERAGSMHYVTDHNGFTLRDLYSYDVRHNEANGEGGRDGTECNFSWNCGEEGAAKRAKTETLRLTMMKNALTVLLLSGGTPMLLAGDEFAHTKSGNNNSYCQDNEISWLDWTKCRKYRELLEYAKTLIAFRKAHPLFFCARELYETDFISCGWPEISLHGIVPWHVDYSGYNRLAGVLLCGDYMRKADYTFEDSFYLVCNMHWEEHVFELPAMKNSVWRIELCTSKRQEEPSVPEMPEQAEKEKGTGTVAAPVLSVKQRVVVPPRSMVLLHGEKKAAAGGQGRERNAASGTEETGGMDGAQDGQEDRMAEGNPGCSLDEWDKELSEGGLGGRMKELAAGSTDGQGVRTEETGA